MAHVEQLRLGDDSWSVVCAACCHMALVFAIMRLYSFVFCLFVSGHSCLIFFFNLIVISIN